LFGGQERKGAFEVEITGNPVGMVALDGLWRIAKLDDLGPANASDIPALVGYDRKEPGLWRGILPQVLDAPPRFDSRLLDSVLRCASVVQH
jgi:hypothetical protein